MEEGSAIAEHLVVASGRTTKHIRAVAQQLAGLLRAQGVKVLVSHTRGLPWLAVVWAPFLRSPQQDNRAGRGRR